MNPQKYSYVQGELFCSLRDSSGAPLGFRSLGNAPRIDLTLGASLSQYAGGQSSLPLSSANDGQLPTVDITLESITRENLALALYSTSVRTQASYASYDLVLGAVGTFTALAHMNIVGGVELTSETGSTVYTEGLDYLLNAKHGTLTVLALGSIPNGGNTVVSYGYGGSDSMDAFSQTPEPLWLRFEGVNTANRGSPVIVDIYKVRMQPLETWALITDDYTQLALRGRILVDRDSTNPQIKRIVSVRQA